MYKATTISANTRVRQNHNTASAVLATIANAGTVIQGENVFDAPVELLLNGSVYQKAGDKWLQVNYNGVIGWVAIIHMGVPICKDFALVTPPPVDPPPSQVFPESFTLVAPDGSKAVYKIVQVI